MAEYKIIKLKNMSPLHIGTGKESYDFSSDELQSDRISAALSAVGIQSGKITDAEKFLNSFTISSAFPYFDGDDSKTELFLPRPSGRLNVAEELEAKHRKELKKMKFVPLNIWNTIVSGKQLTLSDFDSISAVDMSKSQTNERVTISNGGSTPFFFEWNFFKSNAGLYFIVDVIDNTTANFNLIKDLFELLGENGIGTDKNVGGGKFEIEDSSITLPDVKDADSTMLLSSYIPATEAELQALNLENSRYELINRDGYIAGSNRDDFRHLRKKSIYMFNTSSVFATTDVLKGKVVDLAPKYENMHQVLRSGMPLTHKIKTQQQ